MTEKTRQTAVDQSLRETIKKQREHMDVFFHEYYQKAILYFMEYRRKYVKRGEKVAYFTSPQDAQDINIKLSDKLLSAVSESAKDDSTSVRRFLYTAIFRYSEHVARSESHKKPSN